MSDRPRSQRGVATVFGVVLVGVLMFAALAAVVICAVVARQHRADGMADLVAVSSATALQRGEDACQVAQRVARVNDVTMRSCEVDDQDVQVEVQLDLDLPFDVRGVVRGQARAGPSFS